MRQTTGRELAKVLEQQGWVLLRVSGSHHIYGKAGLAVRVSVPIHANKPLKTGLARHLLKIAGLTEADIKLWLADVPRWRARRAPRGRER